VREVPRPRPGGRVPDEREGAIAADPTPRQRALEAGDTRYHGDPCGRCGATERLTCNRKCVACEHVRVLKHFHNLSGVKYNRRLLQMRRVLALRRMAARNERREVGRGAL
jgi:hypothetical protein